LEYKINTSLPIQFEKIDNPPYLNDSRFQAVRCYVAHEKDNYNGSWFDTSVLENMGKHMAGVPIVGYISIDNTNTSDFNGHEERLIIQDGEMSFEYLGRAYGCIISNDDVEIVQRMHESGEMRDYLAVTGILWKMFAESIEIFDRDTSKPHSMELQEDSIKGKFEKDGYYHFTEAKVRALCVLGDGVLPAMSNSLIEKFSTVNYENSIQEMLTEINESIKNFSKTKSNIDYYYIEEEQAKLLVSKANNIFNKLGFECIEWIVDGKEQDIIGVVNKTLNNEATSNWGFDIYDKDTITIHTNDLDKLDISTLSISSVDLLLNSKKSTVQNFSLELKLDNTNFDINNQEGGKDLVDEKLELLQKYNLTLEQLNFSIEEIELDELESKLKEFTVETNKPEITFSATYRQRREALNNALDPKIEKDVDGKITYEEYLWVNDFDDTHVFVEKTIWTPDYENKYGRYTYTFDEATLTATITSEFEEMVLVWLTLEENQKLQDERTSIEANFEKLKGEFEEYKNNYSTLNEEVEVLKEFQLTTLSTQRTQAEEILFSQTDAQLQDNEEYQILKQNASQFSLEQLEKEVAFIIVKSGTNVKFSSHKGSKKQNQTVKLPFGSNHNDENDNKVYGDLFEKYLPKRD